MGFADRLRQVVASNFIEISRDDAPRPVEAQTAPAATFWEPVPEPIAEPSPPVPEVSPYANSADETQPEPALETPQEETIVVSEVAQTITETASPEDATHWLARAADGSLYTGVLGEEGIPDFARLYANATDLPQVLCGAEQASEIVTSLPAELPLRVKRITAKATVDLWSRHNPAILEEILSDAAFKMVKIARLSEAVSGYTDDLQANIEAEVAELERRITERRTQLAEVKRKREAALRACKVRMGALNDVVLFFDHNDVSTNTPPVASTPSAVAPSEDDDLPPHLRNDSVLRLLGLPAEAAAKGNGHSN